MHYKLTLLYFYNVWIGFKKKLTGTEISVRLEWPKRNDREVAWNENSATAANTKDYVCPSLFFLYVRSGKWKRTV